MRGWRCAGALALVVATLARPASSAPVAPAGRVRLLQSSAISPRARRCLTRLREELTAGGFEVSVGEFGGGGEALWTVDPPSSPDGSVATITLVGDPEEQDAELWVVDSVAGGHAAVRRLLVPAGAGTHDDEVLAVRTLEFLRASALELARRAPPPPTPSRPAEPPVTLAVPVARPLPSRPLSFELGLCLLESSRSLGPAVLPLVRLRAALPGWVEARLDLAGLGTRPQVTNAEGAATVGSTFGLVELRAAFRRGHALQPAVGAGAGVLYVQVDGTGNWPYGGLTGHAWSALFDVSGGITLALGRRFAVALEEHAQMAARTTTVEFSGHEAARLARPALLTSLTLVTAL